jgi:hypothetical protein
MDDFYKNKSCRGLCSQADELGMCMGVCSSDFENATQVYFKKKIEFIQAGKQWVDIEDFEVVRKPKLDVKPNIPAEIIEHRPLFGRK